MILVATDRKTTVATILGLALSGVEREFDMKTYIKIAAGLAVLGLLAAACSRDADRQAREASGAEGEPVGEVGTLTDVPTGPGTASSSSEAVNGAVAPEAPDSPLLQGSGTTTLSRSTTNPSSPAATSTPPSAPD